MAILDLPALLARAIILATAVANVRGYTPVDTLAAISNIGALQRLLDVKTYTLVDIFVLVVLVIVIARLVVLFGNTAFGRGVLKLATRGYDYFIRPQVDVVISKITADPPKSCAIVIGLVLGCLVAVLVRTLYRACTFANLLYVGYDLPVAIFEALAEYGLDAFELLSRISCSVFEYAFGLAVVVMEKAVNVTYDLLFRLLRRVSGSCIHCADIEPFWKYPLENIFMDLYAAVWDSQNESESTQLVVLAILVFWLTDLAKAFWDLLRCAASRCLHPLWLNELVDALERDPTQADESSPRGPKVRTLSIKARFFIAFAPWAARVYFTYACMEWLTSYRYRRTIWPLLYLAVRLEIIDRGRWLLWLPSLALNLVCTVVPAAWEACVSTPLHAVFTFVSSTALVVLGAISLAVLAFLRLERILVPAVSVACTRVQEFLCAWCPSAAQIAHAYREAASILYALRRKLRSLVTACVRAAGRTTLDMVEKLDPTFPLTDREKRLGLVPVVIGRLPRAISYLLLYIETGLVNRRLNAEQRQRQDTVIAARTTANHLLWRPNPRVTFCEAYAGVVQLIDQLERGRRPGYFHAAKDPWQLAMMIDEWDYVRSVELIAILRESLVGITEADLVEDQRLSRILNFSTWKSQKLATLRSLLAELIDDGKPIPPHVSSKEQLEAMSDPANVAFVAPSWRVRWVERPVPISLRKRLAYRLRNIEPPTYLVDTWP